MKKALISPLEPVESGYRVAEVANQKFDVCPPLFWKDCADDVVADLYYYDMQQDEFILIPTPPPPVEGAQTL